MEYYTEMKMNELLLQATTCMNFTHNFEQNNPGTKKFHSYII